MTSPRSGRCSGKRGLAALVVLALAAGRPLAAQDTATGVRPDTLRSDTLRSDTLRSDTLRSDTLRSDTLRPDTLRPAGAPARLPVPLPPVDSALARACRTSGGSPPDLVTVVFQPRTSPEERQAVAAEVGGTLVEPGEHQAPGAWYVHVPGSAADKSVADRLILLPPVLGVGTTRCPS